MGNALIETFSTILTYFARFRKSFLVFSVKRTRAVD